MFNYETSFTQRRQAGHRTVSRLTAPARIWGLWSVQPTLQDATVKNDSRTYDFCRTDMRNPRARQDRRVSDLLVDGWSAYYRWLAQLKRQLPVRARRD